MSVNLTNQPKNITEIIHGCLGIDISEIFICINNKLEHDLEGKKMAMIMDLQHLKK